MNDRSRIYTNVILTIIAIFLAIIAFKPHNPFVASADAQILDSRNRNEQQITAFGDQYLEAARIIAASLDKVAQGNESIATSVGKVGDEMRTVGTKIDALARAQQAK